MFRNTTYNNSNVATLRKKKKGRGKEGKKKECLSHQPKPLAILFVDAQIP